MGRTTNCVKFTYDKLHKSWRKGKSPPSVTFSSFVEDTDICVIETLDSYLKRTGSWRSDEDRPQLLLSFISPHKPVCSSTIANWIKKLLVLCRVDSAFTAHSTRSASTSKAKFPGLSEKEILKRACWSGRSTWQNHYRKEIDSDLTSAKNFQDKVFKRFEQRTW